MRAIAMVLLLLSTSSCSFTHDRSLTLEEHDGGHFITLSAKTTALVSPEGLIATRNPQLTVFLVTKGTDFRYRGIPGTLFLYGKDCYSRVDYINGGYIWVSDGRPLLTVMLYSADPPTGILDSYYNGEYSISEDEAASLRVIPRK